MSFESGNTSYRVYEVDATPVPAELVIQFAEHVAPPIETLSTQPISGWVSPRFILDRDINEDNCISGGYVRADLMKAELKIPNSLLKAYCKIEELAEMQARGVPYLNRQTRADIKKRISEELLPKMPPTLTSIPMVIDTANRRVFAEALSETQQDAFCVNLNKTTRLSPIALTPETAAMRMKQIDFRDIPAQCFSPDPNISITANNIGMDFLTWLWFFWETTNGSFTLDNSVGTPPMAFMLEGPAIFFLEGDGAHETALRKGMPLISREAKTVLECGKKLRKVKLVIAQGDAMYSATIDAMDFSFRSLKLPKPETAYEPATAFQDRMAGIQTFTNSFYHLYSLFLDQIGDGEKWTKTLSEMKTWITSRKTVV